MFDAAPYRQELTRRISTIRRMLDEVDPLPARPISTGISREMRGIAVLLLFAAYENLLKSLCRALLDRAISLRVGNKRLQTGFKQFAVHSILVSIIDSGENKLWKNSGKRLLDCAFDGRSCTIDSNIFPSDGSFMKKTQVRLFAEIFGFNDPGKILKEVWVILDSIVAERNDIAHGAKSPEEIGRNYSSADIRDLLDIWELRWIEFINHVEFLASKREFYRHNR